MGADNVEPSLFTRLKHYASYSRNYVFKIPWLSQLWRPGEKPAAGKKSSKESNLQTDYCTRCYFWWIRGDFHLHLWIMQSCHGQWVLEGGHLKSNCSIWVLRWFVSEGLGERKPSEENNDQHWFSLIILW